MSKLLFWDLSSDLLSLKLFGVFTILPILNKEVLYEVKKILKSVPKCQSRMHTYGCVFEPWHINDHLAEPKHSKY